MAAVRAHAVDVARVPRPARPTARLAGPRSRGRACRAGRPGRRAPATADADRRTPRTPRVPSRGAAAGRAGGRAAPGRLPPRPSRERPPRSVGQPGVAQGVDAPRPGVLDQQERAHGRRRAGQRLVAQDARRRAAERRVGRIIRRPRAAPPGPGGGTAPGGSAGRASARSAGRTLLARADLLQRRPQPARVRRSPVAEQDLEPVAAIEQHARVAGAPPQQACRR